MAETILNSVPVVSLLISALFFVGAIGVKFTVLGKVTEFTNSSKQKKWLAFGCGIAFLFTIIWAIVFCTQPTIQGNDPSEMAAARDDSLLYTELYTTCLEDMVNFKTQYPEILVYHNDILPANQKTFRIASGGKINGNGRITFLKEIISSKVKSMENNFGIIQLSPGVGQIDSVLNLRSEFCETLIHGDSHDYYVFIFDAAKDLYSQKKRVQTFQRVEQLMASASKTSLLENTRFSVVIYNYERLQKENETEAQSLKEWSKNKLSLKDHLNVLLILPESNVRDGNDIVVKASDVKPPRLGMVLYSIAYRQLGSEVYNTEFFVQDPNSNPLKEKVDQLLSEIKKCDSSAELGRSIPFNVLRSYLEHSCTVDIPFSEVEEQVIKQIVLPIDARGLASISNEEAKRLLKCAAFKYAQKKRNILELTERDFSYPHICEMRGPVITNDNLEEYLSAADLLEPVSPQMKGILLSYALCDLSRNKTKGKEFLDRIESIIKDAYTLSPNNLKDYLKQLTDKECDLYKYPNTRGIVENL